MRILPLLSMLALLLLGPLAPALAQDITLERLVILTALPEGHKADLGDWSFGPKTPQAAEEKLTWGWWPSADDLQNPPVMQLSLRPVALGFDVLFYAKRPLVYDQLFRALEKQKLTPVPVTCIGKGCTGQRFAAPTYTVAFYEGKPGEYPFVVVVHTTTRPKPAPTQESATAPAIPPSTASALR